MIEAGVGGGSTRGKFSRVRNIPQPHDLDAPPESGALCGSSSLSSMSDLLTVDENQHPPVTGSPRPLSTNGSLTEVDSPNGEYKPNVAAKEADHTTHDSEDGFDDEDYDSEDYDGYDEEDEEDDDEPALKYERLAGSVPDLLLKDSASSLAVADKLIVRTLQSLFSSG